MADRFLTATDLAHRWQVGRRSIYELRVAGGGPPFIRLGPKSVRYRLEDIEAFEREHFTNPQPRARQ